MQTITFNNVELHLQQHSQHEFLLTNKEVALGYGASIQSLTQAKKKNSDELIEGKHWLRLEVQTKGGKQKVIHWTKKGIVRLGFFIKSKEAKVRRDLTTARRLLTIEKRKHRETAEYFEAKLAEIQNNDKIIEENKRLKRTLIDFSNRYHTIVLQSEDTIKAIKTELEKMTNCFQQLPNLAKDGRNLNTDTVAKHSYWN